MSNPGEMPSWLSNVNMHLLGSPPDYAMRCLCAIVGTYLDATSANDATADERILNFTHDVIRTLAKSRKLPHYAVTIDSLRHLLTPDGEPKNAPPGDHC